MTRRRRAALIGVAAVLGGVGAAYGWFGTLDAPTTSPAAGRIEARTLTLGGLERRWQVYLPPDLSTGAPLVIALHGSTQDGAEFRRTSGFRWEVLADREGFAVAYPDGIEGNFNDCRREASYPARERRIDDIGFLRAVVDDAVQRHGTDRAAVFATGYSNGAQMVLRLYAEAPGLLAGGSLAAATLPTDDNWDCAPLTTTPPTLLVHGTEDPLSPYAGGEISVRGFGYRGHAVSAEATGERLAALQKALREKGSRGHSADVVITDWRRDGIPVVRLLTMTGAGHVYPSAGVRPQRILGSTAPSVDMAQESWRLWTADHHEK